MSKYPSYLVHYASEYYDPVKAHEYYMRNRELKGRREGTLNEKGLAAKSYITNQINTERDTRIKSEDASRTSQLESLKTQRDLSYKQASDQRAMSMEQAQKERDNSIKSHTSEMNSKIQSLQRRLSNMSSLQKNMNKAAIAKEIEELRNKNAKKKEALTLAYNTKSATISEDYTSAHDNAAKEYTNSSNNVREASKEAKSKIRSESKETLNKEIDNLYTNSEFIKPKSSKGSSNSGNTGIKPSGKKTSNQIAREEMRKKNK